MRGFWVLLALSQVLVRRVPPTLLTLTPSSGAVGASVVIAGHDFGALQESSVVAVNGVTATATAWSDTSVTVTIPTTTTGNVTIARGGLTSNALTFTVTSSASPICTGTVKYVRAGASGSATGADWTNALTAVPNSASATRGTTYCVATGTYAGRTLTTATSSTTRINIVGATVADHGTATGWSDAFGVDVTPAKWTMDQVPTGSFHAAFFVQSGYWTFDGNSGTDGTLASYGFQLVAPASPCTVDYGGFYWGAGGTVTNMEVKHFAFDFGACGAGDSVSRIGIEQHTQGTFGNELASHIYCNQAQNCTDFLWTNTNQYATGNIIEYMWVPSGGAWVGDGSHHSEQIDMFCQDGLIIRYSHILDGQSTGTVVANDAGVACNTPSLKNGLIYGNVFNGGAGGNGIITATAASGITNTVIYNNTFASVVTGPIVTGNANSSGNTFVNNIVWGGKCGLGSPNGPAHHDNSYLSCTDTAPTDSANGQVVTLNPFTNSGSLDFTLAQQGTASCSSTTATCLADNTLGSPYNIDLLGTTRGADGTWERGAYEK